MKGSIITAGVVTAGTVTIADTFNGQPSMRPVIAGGIVTTLLLFMGQAWPQLASALAWLIATSTLIRHGGTLASAINKVTGATA